MTEKETVTVLATLKAAYPAFYSKVSREESQIAVALWSRLFKNDEYRVVMIALEQLIAHHTGYPPDIAALRKQIDDMVQAASGEPTDEELWHLLRNAARNGYYECREEFEKLPQILQRYLGAPNTLREMAQMDESAFNTVAKGQFLKQIGSIRERQKFDETTPEHVKRLLAASYHKLPSGKEQMSPEQINRNRNRILDQIG